MDRTAPAVLYSVFGGETQMKSPTFRARFAPEKGSAGLAALGAAGILADTFEGPHVGAELLEPIGKRGEGEGRIAAVLEGPEKHAQARRLGAARGNHVEAPGGQGAPACNEGALREARPRRASHHALSA